MRVSFTLHSRAKEGEPHFTLGLISTARQTVKHFLISGSTLHLAGPVEFRGRGIILQEWAELLKKCQLTYLHILGTDPTPVKVKGKIHFVFRQSSARLFPASQSAKVQQMLVCAAKKSSSLLCVGLGVDVFPRGCKPMKGLSL